MRYLCDGLLLVVYFRSKERDYAWLRDRKQVMVDEHEHSEGEAHYRRDSCVSPQSI